VLVYLHVPFCARRCSYCDFAIAVRRTTPSQAFAEAVLLEWDRRQDDAGWAGAPGVETVYFGGGTPSRLEPAALAAILDGIRSRRTLAIDAEITLEANPDDVTPDRARAWVETGINRISLGVQSFHPPTLSWMHRTHQADQVGPAVDALRSAGIANISLDLIYGLPQSLGRDWKDDVRRVLAFQPEHVSFYALTVEQGTPLGKWTRRGEVAAAPDQRVAEEYLWASAAMTQAGFVHYEVSNAARPGYRAVHNAGYWERRPFLGIGPSAHSGWGAERRWNIREWEAYRAAVSAGADPSEGREQLSEDQVRLERTYLGLRTDRGMEERQIPAPELGRWRSAGWATVEAGRVRLTPEGWLRLDALVPRVA
jgi:oxygen-independent coproporphyrinogen-3 oxidase